jgi:arylsulfatase A-like enzyme
MWKVTAASWVLTRSARSGADRTICAPAIASHHGVAWSWAFDTPFKWTKQVASHFGGTRQGMVISWPGHITDAGGIRTQFHHIVDIVPTILEAAGIQAPATVNGITQKPIEGVSMTYTFDKANANAPSKRDTQYFEMFANRGIYHDGWYACTTPPVPPWILGTAKLPEINDYKWELYNSDGFGVAARTAARDARSRSSSSVIIGYALPDITTPPPHPCACRALARAASRPAGPGRPRN